MGGRYASLLLFGAPGVGKGTQGKLLGAIPGFHHLATGDMFRGLDKTSELGQRVEAYSSKGLLVPDELTIELWQQHVNGLIDAGRFVPSRDLLVLDGIPRNVAQAKVMDEHLDVAIVIHLTAPKIDDLVQRMKKRAEVEGRHDDADEAVIRRRFEVYLEATRPVLEHYDEKLVSTISAMGMPIEVLHRLLGALVPVYVARFGNPLE